MANCLINKNKSKISYPISCSCLWTSCGFLLCLTVSFHRHRKQRAHGVCMLVLNNPPPFVREVAPWREGCNTCSQLWKRSFDLFTNPELEMCPNNSQVTLPFLSWHLFSAPAARGVWLSQRNSLTEPWLNFSGCHKQSDLRKTPKRL